MPATRRHQRISPASCGLGASLLTHLFVAGLCAASGASLLLESPQLGNSDSVQIELTLQAGPPESPPIRWTSRVENREYEITPSRAQYQHHVLVDTPSLQLSLQEMIPADVLDVVLEHGLLSEREPRRVESPREMRPEEVLELAEPAGKREPQDGRAAGPAAAPLESPDPEKPAGDERAARSRRGNSPVKLTEIPPLRYPDLARRQGQQGVVWLRLRIGEQGDVTPSLLKSSGFEMLDAAAVGAARRWKATPAKRDGKPYASVWDMPVHFRLP